MLISVGGWFGFVLYKEGVTGPLVVFPESGKKTWDEFLSKSSAVVAVSPAFYAFAPFEVAHDRGVPIDIAKENKLVSRLIQSVEDKNKISFFLIPGFTPPIGGPTKVSHKSKKRMNWAVHLALQEDLPIFIVSGGNVKPPGTPYNEALEMKRHLMQVHRVPENLIVLEPYAQNTVTNLRNMARFMLAHEVSLARIVSTYVHNKYIGLHRWSSFSIRVKTMLGYSLGQLEYLSEWESLFRPSEKVLQKSNDKLDP